MKNKLCLYYDCNKRPSFGFEYEYPVEKNVMYCKTHQLENMINVLHPCCEKPGCKIIASFGITKPIACSKHKTSEMNDLKNKLCTYEGCNKRALYGINKKTTMYCYDHKEDTMTNVVHPTCLITECTTIVNNQKYDGYCVHCYLKLHPTIELVKNVYIKAKEYSVTLFIEQTFNQVKWERNKRIPGGTSKKRPDLLCFTGFHYIIVEIDEHQHRGYSIESEIQRIHNVSKDLSHKSVVVIRFNPDMYINEKGKKIQSCWKINKYGKCVIKSESLWNARLKTLENAIRYWMKTSVKKTVEIHYLFYNE